MSFATGRIADIIRPAEGAERARQEERVRRGFWAKARRAAVRVPFIEDAVAAYFCTLDNRTPARVRGVLLAALAYFVLPVDAIPDVWVGIGFTDDAAVLMAALSTVGRHVRPAHRTAASHAIEEWRTG